MNLSGLSTKSISEPKIQETSTIVILKCVLGTGLFNRNCTASQESLKENKIEINKRFGMPFFIPLISLITCFLLSSRRDKKSFVYKRYIYFFIGFIILICSEIAVRYSGNSLNHTAFYYLLPIALLPFIYLFLIRSFKYENLR